MKILIRAKIILLLLLSTFACRTELDDFNTQVRKLSRDEVVTVEEWESLKALVAANPELSFIDDAELERLINSAYKRKTVVINRPSEYPEVYDETPEVAYNVYVENSGSMYGYMDGNSNFKNSLYDLLTRFNGEGESFNVKLINDEIHPIKEDLEGFMDFFEKRNLYKIGNTASSEINKIFEMIRDSMLKDGKPAIVVSDFIYSLDKHEDMTGELAEHKYGTKAVFQEVKEDYGVLIIKSVSSFNDKYYPFNSPNKGIRVKEDRPFYFWVIGKKEEIKKFADKYNIASLEGYENHMKIYNSDPGNVPFYTILNKTEKIGSFRKDKGSNVITKIRKIDYGRNDVFQFAVAINFENQYIEEDYLKNPGNYQIISSVGNEFQVMDVLPISKIDKNDDRFAGEATHFVTIQTNEITSGDQTLTLNLMKKIPDWVASSSTLDDTSPAKRDNKTFAFSYLVEGVAEAFYKENQNLTYFSLPLILNR